MVKTTLNLFIILCLYINQPVLSFQKSSGTKSIVIENSPKRIELKLEFSGEIANLQNEKGTTYLDYFLHTDESKPGSPVLPSKTVFIAVPNNSKINVELVGLNASEYGNSVPAANKKIKRSNDTVFFYENVELAKDYFTTDFYPSKSFELIGYTWIRNYYCAAIRINTHQFNWKRKIITEIHEAKLIINISGGDPQISRQVRDAEFDSALSKLILNYDGAQQFATVRKRISLNADSWIDFTKDYYKFAVTQDGIYRLTYQDLLNCGLNITQTDPRSIKIFIKGKQIPLYVKGEQDGSFDNEDFIEFWMEKNYGSPDYKKIVGAREDYLNYMDRYSDTTKLWLTADGEFGDRVNNYNIYNPALKDTISEHLVKMHFESDKRLWYYDGSSTRANLPHWQNNKVWTWQFLGGSSSISYNFPVSDYLTNREVNTTVRIISEASNITNNSHKMGSSLNSTSSQDTIIYDYKETVNFTSIFKSDYLKAGINIFRLFGLPTAATVNQSLIDWIDIEYYRKNVSVNDSLKLIIPQGYVQKHVVIKIENVNRSSEDLIIYKVFPEYKRINNYELKSTGILFFTDLITSGDIYFVTSKSLTSVPAFQYKKRITDLTDNPEGADYIIVSNKLLSESVNNYNSFIKNYYKLRTKIVYMDDIYDQFNYGYTNAECIRDFLLSAYTRWKEPSPAYLLLVGDANYDYKHIVEPAPKIRKQNLVPSFGMPVSDVWFSIWDSSEVSVPQMYVGRISASGNSDVEIYLNKHKNYITKRFDKWNKSYLFFSGGDEKRGSELAQIKAANEEIFNSLIKSPHVGGSGNHFYKTMSPVSNFGPFTPLEVQSAIDESGVFISYIGHSGTQTWDNGITLVSDLRNRYKDRHPLISDFGCATGRFAEPDVNAFGELFTSTSPDGQAIAYLGNSSFGFLSTSLRFPLIYYSQFFSESRLSVGEAHLLAKIEQLKRTGFSEVNRVFTYCNFLFGDPIINLAIPSKPNVFIDQNSMKIINGSICELDDSVKLSIRLSNYGSVDTDSVTYFILDLQGTDTLFFKEYKTKLPFLESDIIVSIPVSKVGNHKIVFCADINNDIEEIYENDNSASIIYYVNSADYRPVLYHANYGTDKNIVLLNPISGVNNQSENLTLEVSETENFVHFESIPVNVTPFFSRYNISKNEQARYWWRIRTNVNNTIPSEVYSFTNTSSHFTWFYEKPVTEDYSADNIMYDTAIGWRLSQQENVLNIRSAGSSDGRFASIKYNGQEKLINTFFWGITASVIDTLTLEPTEIKYFQYPNPPSADSLIKYIEYLPPGTTVALAISDDGAQSVLGFGGGTKVRRAIETLGSIYIDSVRYRESWCMVGKKGSPKGSAVEVYKKQLQGQAVIELKRSMTADEGSLSLPAVQNSTLWKDVIIKRSLPEDTQLSVYPIILSSDKTDTLESLKFNGDTASIAHISSENYSALKLMIYFKGNSSRQSPIIKFFAVNYIGVPELGTNYQVVSVSKDSLVQGDSLSLDFYVYNVGESSADSFNIKVELIKPDNSSRILMDSLVTRIDTMSRKFYSLMYRPFLSDGTGNMKFRIIMDSENKISELYEDNNVYESSFYIKPDTTTTSVSSASLDVTFDSIHIAEGDFVSTNPKVQFTLKYPLWFPVQDTTSLQVYLDNERIYYSQMDFFSDTINRKAIFIFEPTLENGGHYLRVFGKNIIGKLESSPGYEIFFEVQNEMKLIDVFNYPNPFKVNTSFTFTITQIPDDLNIMIYTVAGRLIKQIDASVYGFHAGFNSVPWDGKDEDGNFIANGVYLYKVIVKKDDKSEDVIQKLAIIR